jgi:hypothetical protein
MSVNCAWKSSRLSPLQCFYWVSDLIIRSYSFNVVELIMLTVYDSSRWFVTLTDNFTRFTWMFFMKIKGKTVKHIKNFVTLMKTDCSDYSLKHLHTDFECKYLVLKNWFTVNDIIWEPTLFTWRKRRFWAAKSHYLWTCTSYAQRLWPELTPLTESH